jgi:Tfp pilus assembly protein PilZ
MGDPNSLSEEMESIFDDLDSGSASGASPSPAGAAVASIPLPEVSLEEVAAPAFAISEQVAEFTPLNRRRMHGNPALTPAELDRWGELREQLEYAFGSASPPLGGTQRRSLRVPTRLKMQLRGTAETPSTLCDVSDCGAFIETAQSIEVGEPISLEIEAGNGGPVLCIEARVIWSREIGNMDGPAGVGVEFTGIEDSDASILEGILERSLEAVAAKSG